MAWPTYPRLRALLWLYPFLCAPGCGFFCPCRSFQSPRNCQSILPVSYIFLVVYYMQLKVILMGGAEITFVASSHREQEFQGSFLLTLLSCLPVALVRDAFCQRNGWPDRCPHGHLWDAVWADVCTCWRLWPCSLGGAPAQLGRPAIGEGGDFILSV